MTGGRALSFRNLSMGETAAPSFSEENAEGAKFIRLWRTPPLISYLKRPAREPWNRKKMSTLFFEEAKDVRFRKCLLCRPDLLLHKYKIRHAEADKSNSYKGNYMWDYYIDTLNKR